MIVPLVLGALAWEGFWWLDRRSRRGRTYDAALLKSRELGRPLLVVGAPDHGPTAGYGCGDITTDIESTSSCPNFFQSDITVGLPLPSNSVVVFAPCVLEYVTNPEKALDELVRVSGGWLYVVGVEPWTATAWLYPGTKNVDVTQKMMGRR